MKIHILIPTFNEAENILKICNELEKLNFVGVDHKVLVIDDGSPDQTAEIVTSRNFSKISVLRRTKKSGIGPSYLAGIKQAMTDKSTTHLVTMDADGSHQIIDLISLIDAAISMPNKVIIGSRWVSGGQITNWPKYRQLISKIGTWYASKMLRIDISDLTGGFRVYPINLIKKIDLGRISSNGYCFQIEMAFAATQTGANYLEVPINFIERSAGRSKMSWRIAAEAVAQVTHWGLTLRGIGNADKLHYVK